MNQSLFYVIVTLTTILSDVGHSAEPVNLENVVAPAGNKMDEPFAETFSLVKATHFLDSASLQWQKQRKCMTCHTNYAYLYAMPSITTDSLAYRQVREFAENLVNERWPEKGPRWDAEVVATAAALAFNDAATSAKLHESTRTALDRMWTVQREDGGWSWLKCGWPPMEYDDHYGATLAAIAVGVAPDGYSDSESAQAGMKKLREYFKNHPPESLHHEAMLLWASSYFEDLMSVEQQKACVEKLFALQKEDGGWALATLGDWERADGKQQDLHTSDGYATGFVTFVLRQSGMPADSPAILRSIAWIKAHQRESGRWFTRSLNRDNMHFISHAGTAMAIMALDSCDALR